MPIKKVFVCDIDGTEGEQSTMARIGYRTWDDRPDAADWLLVCKPCQDRPIGDLLDAARANRHLIETGEPLNAT